MIPCPNLDVIVTSHLFYEYNDISGKNYIRIWLTAYVLLMSEAIVLLTGENVWSRKLTRRSKSHLHWILQVLGAGFSIVGVCVMYNRKSHHFNSVHSILGIISVGSVIGIFVTGLPALFAGSLRNLVRPVIGKFFHSFLGILCYAVGMATQIYGYKKSWLSRQTSNDIATVFIVTTAMIAVFSLIGSLRSLLDHFKGLFKCR